MIPIALQLKKASNGKKRKNKNEEIDNYNDSNPKPRVDVDDLVNSDIIQVGDEVDYLGNKGKNVKHKKGKKIVGMIEYKIGNELRYKPTPTGFAQDFGDTTHYGWKCVTHVKTGKKMGELKDEYLKSKNLHEKPPKKKKNVETKDIEGSEPEEEDNKSGGSESEENNESEEGSESEEDNKSEGSESEGDSVPEKKKFGYPKEITELLKKNNLEIQSVLSNGKCLFKSLSFYLNENEDLVRFNIVEYLKADKELKELVSASLVNGEDFESYLSRMVKLEEWGGECEIIAASRRYKKNIIIVTQDQSFKMYDENGLTVSKNPNILKTTNSILLYYNGTNHYDGIISQ